LLPAGDADLQRAIYDAVQDGAIRLVDDDAVDLMITRASEIGVGSASLRLALPVDIGTAAEPTSGPARDPTASGQTDPGGYPASPDVQLRVSLNTNLDDVGRRTAVFRLLEDLAAAVDGQEASHVQMSVSMVVPEANAERLSARADAAGGVTSSTPIG
jgi:hypothetical protein